MLAAAEVLLELTHQLQAAQVLVERAAVAAEVEVVMPMTTTELMELTVEAAAAEANVLAVQEL
jgi:alkyl hydroperoxide reductase subunit AhpF